MHVRNTSDRFVCLELGILFRPVFTNILLLACSLRNGLQFKTICLLASLKDGLIIQNHFLTCLLEKGNGGEITEMGKAATDQRRIYGSYSQKKGTNMGRKLEN